MYCTNCGAKNNETTAEYNQRKFLLRALHAAEDEYIVTNFLCQFCKEHANRHINYDPETGEPVLELGDVI